MVAVVLGHLPGGIIGIIIFGFPNLESFKFIVLFLGKTGKKILNEALMHWEFDYEEKKSLTNPESIVIKVSNLRKKNG